MFFVRFREKSSDALKKYEYYQYTSCTQNENKTALEKKKKNHVNASPRPRLSPPRRPLIPWLTRHERLLRFGRHDRPVVQHQAVRLPGDELEAQVRVVAHVQRRVPRPAAALEAARRLLAPRPVEPGRALARRPVPRVRAPAAVQARAGPARLDLGEVARAARALGVRVDPDAHQRRLVRVHHVRQRVDLEHVRAAPLAVDVLVQALVDAHHGDVDAHVFFDLRTRHE